jgi:hypothetical protein
MTDVLTERDMEAEGNKGEEREESKGSLPEDRRRRNHCIP